MALPVRQQMTFWAAFCLVFFVILWALGHILLPFIVGAAVAYILDPMADRLEQRGLKRIWATLVIFALATLVLLLALVVVLPLLVGQIIALVTAAPDFFETARTQLVDWVPSLVNEDSAARAAIANVLEAARAQAGTVITTVLSSAGAALSTIVVLLISPVVAFYLLLDWDRMIARIDELLPRDYAPVIRKLAREIDATLASFVRGQGTVCLILGGFYALALMLVGLQFGLVVGIIAGALTFIPYIGALVGGVLAIGLALFQYWGHSATVDGATVQVATDWIRISLVVAIFVLGQMVEGNILTPKLVGSSIGLHPVWLLLALSAFGTIFGFVGMLIAVPVAAIIGVLVRYADGQYRGGRIYQGLASQTPDDDG